MDVGGKKVLVVGLGLYGGEVATVTWLVRRGAVVTVTDLKTRAQLKKSLEQIPERIRSRVTFVLGKHRAVDFTNTDIIVQNPAVPSDSRYLTIAREANIPIINRVCLFLWNCPARVIGVTGTRGKSTTSSLIHHLLKAGKRKAWLAGLSDKPMMKILDSVGAQDIVVLELSSWMLERTGEHGLSPDIAVVTNLYPDHLNRYSSMNSYAAAKAQVYLHQRTRDTVVLNYDNSYTKKMGKTLPQNVVWFSTKQSLRSGVYVNGDTIVARTKNSKHVVTSLDELALAGKHNLQNTLAAIAVARLCKIPMTAIRKSLGTFRGVTARQEVVTVVKNITYVNDTTATTPDATLAALDVFGNSKKTVVLIAGGAGKNIPYTKYKELARKIYQSCHSVVLLKGTSSDLLRKALREIGSSKTTNPLKVVHSQSSMRQAVLAARKLAQSGDTVLLSPASASFNMFINEYDRGDQFVAQVRSL